MNLDKLYEVYGRLMIQKELLDGQINNVKQQIAEQINKTDVQKDNETP